MNEEELKTKRKKREKRGKIIFPLPHPSYTYPPSLSHQLPTSRYEFLLSFLYYFQPLSLRIFLTTLSPRRFDRVVRKIQGSGKMRESIKVKKNGNGELKYGIGDFGLSVFWWVVGLWGCGRRNMK